MLILTSCNACQPGGGPSINNDGDEDVGATDDIGLPDEDMGPGDMGPGDAGLDAGDEDGGGLDDMGGGGDMDDMGASTSYIENCGSFFAARIVEKQIDVSAGFPLDCAAELTDDIGQLTSGGNPICQAGESANACRRRIYDNPPDLRTDAPTGCAGTQPRPDGCLLGKWLPKCSDGTNQGCNEPDVVCQDGTRPMIYAEAATRGSSNAWIFHMGGEGGPCSGDRCWFNYRYTSSIPHRKAMSSVYPDSGTAAASIMGEGITVGAPVMQNPFASFNRVKFERCSDSSSQAIEQLDIADGLPEDAELLEQPDPAPPVAERISPSRVWHHGFPIWKGLLHGLTTDAGRDLDGDQNPELPSLADATQVILVGSSDASLWIVHAADALRAEIRSIAGPDVDVRIVIDGYFEPALDNEGRYHPDAPANFNIFDHPYHTTQKCELPDNGDGESNEACSDYTYSTDAPSSAFTRRHTMDARGSLIDDSCRSFHSPDLASCYDKFHVLTHHVDTPFAVVADQEDPVVSKYVIYSDSGTYRWSGPTPYRTRVLDQAHDIATTWTSAAREDGPGTAGDALLLLHKQRRGNQPWGAANHTHLGSNDKIQWEMTRCDSGMNALTTTSIGEVLGRWFTDNLPGYAIIEDASRWSGQSPYWVTGDTCIQPE